MKHVSVPVFRFRILGVGCSLVAVLSAIPARADVKGAAPPVVIGRWVPTLETALNLTQGSFSKNWTGGDQGSIVWTLNSNATLTNQLSSKVNWDNNLKMAYGQTHQQKLDSATQQRHWDRPETTTDLLDFVTIFRFTLGQFVDPFVSGHFQSQFQDASDPSGRNLSLNPITISESAGFARQLIKSEDQDLLTRVGLSIDQNSRKTFTFPAPDITTTKETTSDAALEWVTDSKTKVLQKRVAWSAKLIVDLPLHYSEKTAFQDALGRTNADTLARYGLDANAYNFTTTVRADWENIFSSQITKIISVNLYTRWVYQKYDTTVKPKVAADGTLADPAAVVAAIRKAGQFKETLSLGVTYRFL